MTKPDTIDRTPPSKVAENAAHGLDLREKYQRGGTKIGVARARDLKNRRNLSPDTIDRMVNYFARHEVDKHGANFGNEEDPSAGYIAWLLWGGDAGRDWAERTQKALQNA
ncbi:hypothetical protein A8B78_11855 [Jannaschia sp. EhC01]|nr:hypothetical protein A8B78_11855 [Jannaschia sp. EhC01]